MSSSQPVERHRVDHRDLPLGHRHQRRADGRAEPAAPRRGAAARGGAAPGRAGGEGQRRLPDDRRADVEERARCRRSSWGTSPSRAWWTSCAACPASATCARSRSEYAMRIWLDPAKLAASTSRRPTRSPRCRSRTASRAGGALGDRPLAGRQRAQRGDPHAEPLHHARAVREHHPARQPRRLGRSGSATSRASSSARRATASTSR